jgi:hypothetical protein
VTEAQQLLRRLAAGDERSLQLVVSPTAEAAATDRGGVAAALDRRIRVLVRLAALLAIDASIETVRWAVELAMATGASDAAMAAVLLSTAPETGGAQVAASASSLALALGFDVEATPDY